jgi:trimethylamine--corrinoid protein Co-methyltransferase
MIQTHGANRTSAHYARLGPEERAGIHQASLEILQRVGVEVHDEQARAILAAGGADVDGIHARIPEHMVTRALSTAPSRMILYDRNGRVAMRAGGYNSYFGGGSDCLYILDHRTGERRRALLSDVVDAITLMDALPEFDFVMSTVLPSDVDQILYDRYQMEVMLNRTTKPIVYVSPELAGCQASVAMCEAVAGGAEAFRRRPFAACYINVTSGLIAGGDALQKCIYLAEKGLPQLWIPLNAGGVNSPTTIAGCAASMNAGTLLGIVLSQLVNEGTPIGAPGWNGGPYNLKTLVGCYVLADEQGAPTEMGRYYDLPVFGLGGATDSKVLDQQAGVEMMFSLMTALLHGANIVHDLGFMNSGMLYSFQLAAIADEMLGFLRAATRGVEVNEETLALDVIEELGATGQYLTHPHTVRHYKESFYGRLLNKMAYAQWERQGATTMEERAAQLVDTILAEHEPEPLPEAVQEQLRAIVAREQAGKG